MLIVVVGYGTWYRLLKIYDVNQAMPFLLLMPPIAVLSAGIALGEPLTWGLVVGGLVTVAGVAIILVRRPRLVEPGAERV